MERVAVLASGGLDSSVLLADLARDSLVFPIYVRMGLAWEQAELGALESFLGALGQDNVHPVSVLHASASHLYGRHWSLTGEGVPGAGTPDSAVYLPGRNVLLIGLAAVWCAVQGVSRIAIGSLGGNPFPDATEGFFKGFADALSQGLARPITVEAPYRGLHKDQLVRRHAGLPLGLTLTCMGPMGGVHCGRCNKCHERRLAFAQAGVADRAEYAAEGM